MPWCEYLIKSVAYNRMAKEEWRKFRLVAYNARIGSHLDPKSLPRNEHDFMPIDKVEKSDALERTLEELRKARKEQSLNKDK